MIRSNRSKVGAKIRNKRYELVLIYLYFPAIPIDDAEKSTHIAICITARGGHIGFLEGWWPSSKDQYMGRLFSEFFGATLKDELNFDKTSAQMIQSFNQKI